jgi:8-oxo-dGTP diphosphatase
MLPNPTYCPVCSQTLTARYVGGRERAACDNCGYVHFVNPVPGVGLLIEAEGGVVLIQRGHPPHQGLWSLPSGFVEADESSEEAAIREAEEETGLKVEIIELAAINSFPEGPPVSGIMIFYRARPVGGDLCAGDDASAVRIFQPDELPLLPFRTHREMIAEWLDRQQSGQSNARSAPKPEFIIRPVEHRDLNELAGLLALIPTNRNLQAEAWRALMQRVVEADTVELYVAETTQSPPMLIGCAALGILRRLTDSVGLIDQMAVLPTYQRRGVGAELLEAIMRRAGQLGLRALWVDKRHANDQAKAFLTALGFQEVDMLHLRLN